MKKTLALSLLFVLSYSIFAQTVKIADPGKEDNIISSGRDEKKENGMFNTMHFSLLLGVRHLNDVASNYRSAVSPSFTISHGYIFNEHWAAGAGVGFEIFNYNVFPLFAEIRYSFRDNKISPLFALKAGYSYTNFKATHYDELQLSWPPYIINDASLQNYGGFMFNPETGVRVTLDEGTDLLFTVAYRFQKSRSVARKDYPDGQFDEWEHKEGINRLSVGMAILFR